MNTKDEYLTSDTLEGAVYILKVVVQANGGVEFWKAFSEKWSPSTADIFIVVDNLTQGAKYRIKNPNYIKPEHTPQFGDIYATGHRPRCKCVFTGYHNGDIRLHVLGGAGFIIPQADFNVVYTFTGRRLDLDATVEVEE